MVKSSKYFIATILLTLFLFGSQAQATNPIITDLTDVWFEYSEPTQFVAETFMVEGYPSDPQLWLYDSQDVLIVSNDDHNGLQSYISVEVQPGKYRLRAGTCCWDPNFWRSGGGWNIQYELSFGNGSLQTTSTLEELLTTTLPPTTTTVEPTTTTTTTSTTTTSIETTTSTTSTTELPTTTTSSTTTTTLEPTTTSSSTTVPIPQTTEIPLIAPSTTAVSTTTTTSTVLSPTTSYLQTTTTTFVLPTTTTSTPPLAAISSQEATKIALDPELLASATQEQAVEVFKALDIEELSEAQVIELVESVQEAPIEIREAFEEEINIFSGGGLDSYVPVGSNIPVKQRRALIAIGAVTSVAPTLRRKK